MLNEVSTIPKDRRPVGKHLISLVMLNEVKHLILIVKFDVHS